MPDGRVYTASLTVPAGTPPAAPVSAVLQMPVGIMKEVKIVIPAGHCGLTGIQVALAGTPIVPYSGTAFISGNNDSDTWGVDQDVNPGQVTLGGYNTDVYPHTFYVRALWLPPPPPPAVTGSTASSGSSGIDTGIIDQFPTGGPGDGGTGGTGGTGTGGICTDIDGNVVDCSDPAAVCGPFNSLDAASVAIGTGPGGTPGVKGTTCYDADGNVVDCSDPAAVCGPVKLPGPIVPGLPPGAGQPGKPPPAGKPPAKPPVRVTRPPGGGTPPPQHRPYRHIADGTKSLDEVAAADKTTAPALEQITRGAAGLTRAELAAFDAYVREGTQRRMHKGLAYYTDRP